MNREVMNRQMFAQGGFVRPMQEGGIASMQLMPQAAPAPDPAMMGGMPPDPAMMGGMPPEEMSMDQAAQGAMAQGVDPAMLEQTLGDYQQGMNNLDNAEDYETVINTIRGDQLPMQARYDELAGMVGPEDATATPESVLTLIQPVMQMAAVDQGIGGLAQDEMMAPIEGPMAEGIMSTVNMGAAEGPAPVNFNQGGAVQYMNNGGPVQYMAKGGVDQNSANLAFAQSLSAKNAPIAPLSTYPSLDDNFASARERYRTVAGPSAYTEEDLAQEKDLTKAQMYFDLAAAGLAFAAPGDRQMSAAEKLASAARDTQLFEKIGARAKEQQTAEMARKTAMRAENMQLDLAAMGSAETLTTAQAKARSDLATMKKPEIKTKNFMIMGKPKSMESVPLGGSRYNTMMADPDNNWVEADTYKIPDKKVEYVNFMDLANPKNILSFKVGSQQAQDYLGKTGWAKTGDASQTMSEKGKSTIQQFIVPIEGGGTRIVPTIVDSQKFKDFVAAEYEITGSSSIADTKKATKNFFNAKENKIVTVYADSKDERKYIKLKDWAETGMASQTVSAVGTTNWVNRESGDVQTTRNNSTRFEEYLNSEDWAKTDSKKQVDASYSIQNFIVPNANGKGSTVVPYFVGSKNYIDAVEKGYQTTGDATQTERVANILTFENEKGEITTVRDDDTAAIDNLIENNAWQITTQGVSKEPKAPSSIRILNKQSTLDDYANGTLTGDALNEFEALALGSQDPTKRIENGVTIITPGTPFTRAFVEAYQARVAAGHATSNIPMPKIPATVSQAVIQLTEAAKDFGVNSKESYQILSNSVDPRTGAASQGLLLTPQFNKMLLNSSGIVDLNSPAWSAVPTTIFDFGVDYDLAQGLGTAVPRLVAGFREIKGQLGGDRINANDQMLYQADNDFGLLKMNTVAKLQAGLRDGRILKRTNDMIFNYLKPLDPGIMKFDANTLATMESIRKQLAVDLNTHVAILAEYGADPTAIAQASDEKIRKSVTSAKELRSMIAEFTKFSTSLRAALDPSVKMIDGQVVRDKSPTSQQKKNFIYNLANPAPNQ